MAGNSGFAGWGYDLGGVLGRRSSAGGFRVDLGELPDILGGVGLEVLDVLDGVAILMRRLIESEVSLSKWPPTQLAA